MYRVPSMPVARRWVGRLVVICAGVKAGSPFSPPSRTLGNRNSDPLRVPTAWVRPPATAQLARQSR